MSLSFGETNRDFGVREAPGFEFGLVSVLGQMLTAEYGADRKLLRESGIGRWFCEGSPLAHEKTPGSKLFRHRGLSGVTSTLLKLELRQLENGDCLGEKECRV